MLKIAIASGKGGTGKTLVATSLALSLADNVGVQLLDCDVEAPNAHFFLDLTDATYRPVEIKVPVFNAEKCTHCGRCAEVCAFHAIACGGETVMLFPELCHGCGACSYLCPSGALVETGREIGELMTAHQGNIAFVQGRLKVGEALAVPLIREVKHYAGETGVTLIDAPPGVACPVIESVRGCDFCVLVTEPTPFGMHDLKLALGMLRQLRIPSGVVINRAVETYRRVEEYCAQQGVPVLLRIPLDMVIAESYSRGITLAAAQPEWQPKFRRMLAAIGELVGERTGHTVG
jgi:MinD superfamily P-loop ATPase